MKFSNYIIPKKGHGNGSWPFLFIGVLVCIWACQHPKTLPLTDEDYADSTQVANAADTMQLVRPVIVDSLMRPIHCASQFDADTALVGGTAIAGTTSRKRLEMWNKKGMGGNLDVVCSVEEVWSLVACGRLRVRKVKDLKGLTVAVAREDASSVICDRMVVEAGVPAARVYHPQINDLGIRCQMLTNSQIDGAMLTEPYTSQARAAGHRIIKTVVDTTQTILVVNRNLTPEQRKSIRTMLHI